MSKYICCLVMSSLLIAFTLPVMAADEVMMKNGDRLTGKVVEQSDTLVIVETGYAGTVKIAADQVAKVSISEPAANSPESPQASTDAKATQGGPVANVKAAPQHRRKLFGGSGFYGIADGWEGDANAGFSYTSGNTGTATMTTGIRAAKAGVDEKLIVYLRSQWNSNRKSSDNATTRNAVWGGARYDRNVGDRIFGFASFDFERDRPKLLNFRSVVGAGAGHHTIKNDRTELDLLLGGAWNRSWQTGENTDTPEILVGTSLKHRFNGRLKFQNSFTFFQNVTDRAEYRSIFDSTLSAAITKRIGWYVSVGNRYNNDPVGASEKNDFLFTTGMKWNFGKAK